MNPSEPHYDTGHQEMEIARTEHRHIGGAGYKATANYDWDGAALKPRPSAVQAQKITVVGSVTYIAVAPAGTAQSSAAWQARKIDQTTGTVITWADSGNYTQVATDLTTLTYA